jgi:TonB family protein
MPRRVVIPSIVLVLLGVGWTFWPRVAHRDVPIPAVWQSTPSAVDEAGTDQALASVSSASTFAEHAGAQLAQDSAVSRTGQPQRRRAHSNAQARLRSIVRQSPQESVGPRGPQGDLSPPSLRQVAAVPEDAGTGASTSGLGADPASTDGDLKPPDTRAGTLGEPTIARVPILRPPVLLAGPPPEYPSNGYQVVLSRSSLTSQLQVEATEGRVILRLLVVANGGVDRVEVTVSSGVETLDQAAATAVRAWRFAPATWDGQPIDAWVAVPIRFVVR